MTINWPPQLAQRHWDQALPVILTAFDRLDDAYVACELKEQDYADSLLTIQ